ncbi:MAG: AAA family ATPase, partial [Chloroflexi bacterium]|nr:AAA family ATPase [Chloroflexota bacterium]
MIITTKLRPPRLPRRRLERPHLVAQLNSYEDATLILVSALAGAGKTSLVREWLNQLDRPWAWFALDEADNDPVRFFTYWVAALQTIDDRIGYGLIEALRAPQAPDFETLLMTLINDCAAASPFVLVLDDYHLIESSALHHTLETFMDYAADGVQIVLTTRNDPPFRLGKLRGSGQLAEIRAVDLQLDPEELGTFFDSLAGLTLSRAQVEMLHARTEGWMTGVQLASLSAQGQADLDAFIQFFAGSHRFVLDYLVDEVLAQLSDEESAFLIQTALLTRLNGDLCDTLLGRSDSAHLLAELERRNLFVIPLDEERYWYRYHQLFADLLRRRLAQANHLDPRVLHQRAASWYEAHGWLEAAIDHWRRGGQDKHAARLIGEHGIGQLLQGEIGTLARWLDRLPVELQAADPWLGVLSAWTQVLQGQPQQALAVLDGLTIPRDESLVLGNRAAIRGYASAIMQDLAGAERYTREALDYLPQRDPVRAVVEFTLGGIAAFNGQVNDAVVAFQRAADLGRATGNLSIAIPALGTRASHLASQGYLERAESLYLEARDLSTRADGVLMPYATHALIGLAEVDYERNQLERCQQHLLAGMPLAERSANQEAIMNARLAMIRLHMARQEFGQALDLLDMVETILNQRRLTPGYQHQVDALRVMIWRYMDRTDEIGRWLKTHETYAHLPVN